MIGLGRMGSNMVRRLLKAGHEGVVFDVSPKAVETLVHEKAVGASSLGGTASAFASDAHFGHCGHCCPTYLP